MPNRQIEKAKQEMATMYKIIKNDGGEDELSQDQPLLSMIKFNIAIMLDKFKEMGEEIKKLNEENGSAWAVYTDFKLMKEERDGLKEAWEREEKENEELKEENETLKGMLDDTLNLLNIYKDNSCKINK